MITATIHYRLSAAGQRAALVAGVSAALGQDIVGEISPELLPVCEVDGNGKVAINTAVYGSLRTGQSSGMELDAPPDSAQLLAESYRDYCAARAAADAINSAKRQAEHDAEKAVKLAAEQELVSAFLADPKWRGQGNGIYTASGRTYGNILYLYHHPDRDTVMAEINRRNSADAIARTLEAERQAAERRAFVEAWLRDHGTANQRERYAADLLPESEYVTAMESAAFEGQQAFAPYDKITDEDVREAIRESDDEDVSQHADSDLEISYRSEVATELSAEQWDAMQRIRSAFPTATVDPRVHQATADNSDIPWGIVERHSAKASLKSGPFTFTREFAL